MRREKTTRAGEGCRRMSVADNGAGFEGKRVRNGEDGEGGWERGGEGGWPQAGGREREEVGRGIMGGWCTRGGWTRSLWQPWLGFRAPRRRDGLGNVSTRLGMDFSRFATKWG